MSSNQRVRTKAFAVQVARFCTALPPYWMELLIETGIVTPERMHPLMKEPDELIAMAVTAVRTIKSRRR